MSRVRHQRIDLRRRADPAGVAAITGGQTGGPSCSRRNEQSITSDDNTFSLEDKPFSLARETFHVPSGVMAVHVSCAN